ncbi:hypothetical protein BC833DRAFT_654527 [Globomyces pollinis-pini]|nr:hypothetical protein BC833DRAFT_654527 [Globomyces pollinis-pini]
MGNTQFHSVDKFNSLLQRMSGNGVQNTVINNPNFLPLNAPNHKAFHHTKTAISNQISQVVNKNNQSQFRGIPHYSDRSNLIYNGQNQISAFHPNHNNNDQTQMNMEYSTRQSYLNGSENRTQKPQSHEIDVIIDGSRAPENSPISTDSTNIENKLHSKSMEMDIDEDSVPKKPNMTQLQMELDEIIFGQNTNISDTKITNNNAALNNNNANPNNNSMMPTANQVYGYASAPTSPKMQRHDPSLHVRFQNDIYKPNSLHGQIEQMFKNQGYHSNPSTPGPENYSLGIPNTGYSSTHSSPIMQQNTPMMFKQGYSSANSSPMMQPMSFQQNVRISGYASMPTSPVIKEDSLSFGGPSHKRQGYSSANSSPVMQPNTFNLPNNASMSFTSNAPASNLPGSDMFFQNVQNVRPNNGFNSTPSTPIMSTSRIDPSFNQNIRPIHGFSSTPSTPVQPVRMNFNQPVPGHQQLQGQHQTSSNPQNSQQWIPNNIPPYGSNVVNNVPGIENRWIYDDSIQSQQSHPFHAMGNDKPYKCTGYPDCNKAYKNSNGLKYHRIHVHGEFPIPQLPQDQEISASQDPTSANFVHPQFRRYQCPYPECDKKYKNISGLRYHLNHTHTNLDEETTRNLLKDAKDRGDAGEGAVLPGQEE